MKSSDTPLIEVARLGRVVGLSGELKLHIHCDFPEQFKAGKSFTTQKGLELEVASFNPKRELISFVGYQGRDVASALVNSFLLTTQAATEADCELEEGEFYWYDVIGSVIEEDGSILGVVEEIERIGDVDYMVVKTDITLVEKGLSKVFYLPYIERYIIDFDKVSKTVSTKEAIDLLESS